MCKPAIKWVSTCRAGGGQSAGEFRLGPCKEAGRRETVTGEVAGVGLEAASGARALPRRSALQTGFREQKKEEKGKKKKA